MTTIAWDGITLAADSQADNGGLIMPVSKLYRGQMDDGTPFIFGGAGDLSQCVELFSWIKTLTAKNCRITPFPKYQANTFEPSCVVVVAGLGAHILAGSIINPVMRRFHACGSGRDYAMMAMHLGKSALEAVGLACEFDTFSGGNVSSMILDTWGKG